MPAPSDAPGRSIRLALTPGEPAGIGPDLVIALNGSEQLRDLPLELIVVADPELLQTRAKLLNKQIQLQQFDPLGAATTHRETQMQILPVPLHRPSQPGILDPNTAAYVIKTLESALDGCIDGQFDGLVTGPVHKANLNAAGFPFSGHTEWLAQKLTERRTERIAAGLSEGLAEPHAEGLSDGLAKRSTERKAVASRAIKPVMMLVTEGLRVALATTHLPLRQVPQALSRELLLQVVRILHKDLGRWFAIAAPRILVCGLNPHAGEAGYLGSEEIEIITPALEQLRSEGINLTGPVPADTAFTPRYLEQIDVVLAMYHDQGLPVLKQMGFGASANITLGLPLLRTSVDHGTALDLAGKGIADPGSLLTAIRTACTMAQTAAPAKGTVIA